MTTLDTARTPAGLRLYAIGDVHGCLTALQDVHAAIAADLDSNPVDDWRIIHVGDYVDRGEDNRGVIQYLTRCVEEDPRMHFIMGNHDEMFLAGINGDPHLSRVWLANGGEETLAGYRVGVDVFADRFRDRVPTLPEVPESHVAFLRGLDLLVQYGDYAFVHAGIEPDVPLSAQTRESLLWMREPFLGSDQEFEAVIVHGHTPRRDVEVRRNRIGIDTGAVFGNRLSCIVLEGDQKSKLIGQWREPLRVS
ncbi:MAG: metallophosphoesterase family protein [Pseudomonadota bacterium]